MRDRQQSALRLGASLETVRTQEQRPRIDGHRERRRQQTFASSRRRAPREAAQATARVRAAQIGARRDTSQRRD
eukprot:5778729-Pyramimonas_sp.AAC.1